jgi:hypothetical protein
MVGAKQLTTLDLSWFRPGPYVQQGCARGTVLLCTVVPVVGRLQARRERRRGLQVPSGVIEASANIVGELRSACVLSDVRSPLRRGGSPSFYRPRRGWITSMPHCLATLRSLACSAAELAAVLTVLATVLSLRRTPYWNRGGFEGEGVVVGCGVLKRARENRWRWFVRDTVAGVAASRPHAPNSAGVVVAVPSVVLQARGRPHRTNSGGDGVPPAWRHGLTLQIHERGVRGCGRPPFEGTAR